MVQPCADWDAHEEHMGTHDFVTIRAPYCQTGRKQQANALPDSAV